ncbi:MAG TPA: hypothetical protein VHF89_08500 [Solirubrobacteraceae bacterium]|nr:hypothetical protein [Solirubrobacteraceae bacterium]
MRTDPTDNGGLFIGRRPGTAPVRYRSPPDRKLGARRAVDELVAASIVAFMGLVAMAFWGPIPAVWLWIGGQVKYHTDSIVLNIVVAFLGMLLTLLAGLALLKRLDHFWILVRRAAGYDQRKGIIGPVFAIAAIIGVSLFTFWFLFIAGPGPQLAPS